MSKERKTKVYVLTSNCEVIGIWTNLTKLVNDLGNTDVSYFKLYRKIKSLKTDVDSKAFKYEFINTEGVEFQITIKDVN